MADINKESDRETKSDRNVDDTLHSKSNVPLSKYASNLEPHVKQRYIEKISPLGVDPLLIPEKTLDPECLPPVEATDLLSYFVLDTSYYTKSQFKAFRSLEAYNQMVSGFITSIQGRVVGNYYVVVGKVRHSQRMNEPPVQAWIITAKEGTIVCAHCIGCMAGLGECCSHVASLLFYTEVWTRLNGKLSCTQVKCSWILPTYVKEISYCPVRDINFMSAKKMRKVLDSAVDAAPVNDSQKPQRPCKQYMPSPTVNEMEDLYKALSNCKVKPVALSLVQPYAKEFVAKSRDIPTISDLFSESYLEFEYHDLLKVCSSVEISITDEDVQKIEEDTRDQSKGNSFFQHRAGRIGASASKAACHTNPAQPSKSLIKSISYPNIFQFSNEATEYGKSHEEAAIKAFHSNMIKQHKKYEVSKCGTYISKENPWLLATPDFMSVCDCCGKGCGEIKCLFSIDGVNFEGYLEEKSSCLTRNDEQIVLKRDHQYYFQVQQQLFITKADFCDFVVCAFSKDGTILYVHERIYPDTEHWNLQLPKLKFFWQHCILPEILGRWYTRKCELIKPAENGESVCFCRMEREESTVKCSGAECPISNYHPSCLKIDKFPKAWLCPYCHRTAKVKSKKNEKSIKVKAEKDATQERALKMEMICKCGQKAKASDKLIECHNATCKRGKFFHLECLGYKKRPNNSKSTWKCDFCRTKKYDEELSCDFGDMIDISELDENIIDQEMFEDDEVEVTKTTVGKAKRYEAFGSLTDHHYQLISSPSGWLDCDIIQEAQVLLQKVNPGIAGFQRPTLGPVRNFEIVTSEFIQILHVGNSHWVCVSSIGCNPGDVKLFDSLFRNIVLSEVEDQVKCLVGEEYFKQINPVSVQQQNNGSDCGIFAIAFATCLAYGSAPEMTHFDTKQMRRHLLECLKSESMEIFPTLD